MEENGNLVKFIFNPDREVIAEQNSLGITRYIRSSELIARNTDAARTYYHYVSDEMGSVTHVVDADGIVLNRYEYDAWGNTNLCEEKVPNRFKFTGQQLDPVTQQYYLRARFYNPVIARFTQEDTYRGDGLNLYAYCQNNPVFYTDPSGNVCPEGTKDPLLHAPVPSPNQQQSTALVPYDPHFASEQRRLQGDIYQDAKNNWHDKQTGRFVSIPTSFMPASHQPLVPKASIPTPHQIGSIGEYQLQQMYQGKSQVYYKTSIGKRFVDQLSNDIAHESKVGYTSLTSSVKIQALKDAELLRTSQVRDVQWHFFESPITGKKVQQILYLDF